jgi:hypothetical protein
VNNFSNTETKTSSVSVILFSNIHRPAFCMYSSAVAETIRHSILPWRWVLRGWCLYIRLCDAASEMATIVRSVDLKELAVKHVIFWDMTSCSLVEVY